MKNNKWICQRLEKILEKLDEQMEFFNYDEKLSEIQDELNFLWTDINEKS